MNFSHNFKQLEINAFFCLRGCFEAFLFKKQFTYFFNKPSGFIITIGVLYQNQKLTNISSQIYLFMLPQASLHDAFACGCVKKVLADNLIKYLLKDPAG